MSQHLPEKLDHRVLIVDDNPLNIDILVEILGRDHRIHVATSGALALKIVALEKPDLILLDVVMPDMDGFEVCRALQADPDSRRIPVIFITSKDDAVDETKGFQAGCVDYITKPVNPAIVRARVKTHLHLQTARQALEDQNQDLMEAARLREDMERITRHDLKNPLTGVFSGVELMEGCTGLNEEQLEYLGIIKDSAHKVLRLINFSLDLFKMEQKIYRPIPVDVDVLETLRLIEKEFSSMIRLKKSRLDIQVNGRPARSGEVLLLKGEPLLFYSMLVNLVKNALEASPTGTPVTISFRVQGREADIEIHNQGAVPRAIRADFFEKYTTWGKNDGTGLGTYSARLIAHTLKGDISMATSRESGTRITICLGREGQDTIEDTPLQDARER
ncbi:MAG: hybrid sensor histidine kinase/response regulator [Desulfobacterales bacterium]|nr:hybrid sensor histidine kinase/response regulator [Desulfobacterales bacterium]